MELHIFLLSAFAFLVLQSVSAYPTKGHPYKSEHCIKMTPEKEKEINAIVARLTDFLNNITAEFEDYDIRLVKLDIERHSEDETGEKEVQLELTVNDCVEYEEWNNLERHYESKERDVITEIPTVRAATIEKDAKTDTVEVKEKCSCAENAASKFDFNSNNVNNIHAPAEIIWFFDVVGSKNDNTYDGITYFNGNKEVIDHQNQRNEAIDEKNEIVYHKNDAAVGSNKEIQSKKPEFMPLDLTGVGEDVWDILNKRKNKPLLVYVQKKSDQDEYIFL
nr:P47 [Ephestia kuehniella]